MAENVDRLRRRAPGDRIMVYLDQSTLSGLALEERFVDLRELLRGGVQEGSLVCPESLEQEGETLPVERWEDVWRMHVELSMGVSFRDDEEIVLRELGSAASAFLDEPTDELWKEAFTKDPQTPRNELFGGDFLVDARFPPDPYRLAEIAHEKAKESEEMTAVYEHARTLGRTFEEQTEAEFEEMVYWKLGPLVDAERFATDLERRKGALVADWLGGTLDVASGSAYSRYIAFATRQSKLESFSSAHPGLAGRIEEFVGSPELRSLPSLRYPALLRAAIALTPGRKAKPGDGYDISHLTKGLSRCDIVTADAGMTELILTRKLLPRGCQLFRYADIEGLADALERALVKWGTT